jgi:hypothetical protein
LTPLHARFRFKTLSGQCLAGAFVAGAGHANLAIDSRNFSVYRINLFGWGCQYFFCIFEKKSAFYFHLTATSRRLESKGPFERMKNSQCLNFRKWKPSAVN